MTRKIAADEKVLVKLWSDLVDAGCSCDGMHGYTCGIHVVIVAIQRELAAPPVTEEPK